MKNFFLLNLKTIAEPHYADKPNTTLPSTQQEVLMNLTRPINSLKTLISSAFALTDSPRVKEREKVEQNKDMEVFPKNLL